MIRFFRDLRKKLLGDNDLRKYLVYAIGEIILVMIGILLALQVNNWNQSNKRDATERKMLKELLVNLRKDSIDHTINIEWYKRVEHSAELITQTLEARRPWHDTLATHFGNLYTHGISTLNRSAYDNLKSIGFDIISNDSIRIALTNLYTIYYELVSKTEDEFAKDNHNQMVLPVLTTRLRMDRWFHAVPWDYQALMDDRIFQETVRWRGITMAYVGNNTNDARKQVSKLIRMIERELN